MKAGIRNAVLLLALCASSAQAQQWSAELQTGRIRSSLDPSADPAYSVAGGIRFQSTVAQIRLLGGVPTAMDQPYWGALAAATRLAAHAGSFAAGIDLGANGFVAHDRSTGQELPELFGASNSITPGSSGHAYAVQALPLIGLELPHLQLHARAGVSHFGSAFGQQRRRRTAQLADLQMTIAPVSEFALIPAIKHVRLSDSSYTFAGAAAVSSFGRLTLWGSAGRWLHENHTDLEWAGGATMRLHPRLELSTSVRHDGFDPLYLTVPQTSWNIGLLFHVTRIHTARAPVPARYVNGRATIRLAAAAGRSAPRIAGDFNQWQPQPMQRGRDAWIYDVALKPGVYNYAFVDEAGRWFVPEQQPGRKEDGMGGYVAVLVVQP